LTPDVNALKFATMTPPEVKPTPWQTFQRFAQTWAITTFAVALAAWVLRGIDYVRLQDLLLASLLLGLLNAFVRPVLLKLALPLLVVTLGFFLLVINAALLSFVGVLVPGFKVAHFGWALGGAAIISFSSLVLNLVTGLSRARIQMRQAGTRMRPPPRNHDDGGGPVIDV
jgi:putative membrane protein